MADETEKTAELMARLHAAGLRATRQRVELARLLFADGDRHVTAEILHAEALQAGISVSLATIYNTLNQFAESGLLRAIAIDGARTYLDTNTSNHQHFYFESDGRLVDVDPDQRVQVSEARPPEGMRVTRIDVLIRLADCRCRRGDT